MRTKRMLLPVLVAVMMMIAMMPMTAGTVFAEASTDAVYTPLDISSGFNKDGILEAGGNVESIDSCSENGYGFYALNETSGSLPLDRMIWTSTGHYYKLGDYASKNVCVLTEENYDNALTLAFAEDSRSHYSSLAFIVTGGNNGGAAEAKINMIDPASSNTKTAVLTIAVPDWNTDLGSGAGAVYRCGRVSTADYSNIDKRAHFGLFEVKVDIPDNDGYVVTSVDLKVDQLVKDDSTICIFAVSGVGVDTEKCTAAFDANGGTATEKLIRVPKGETITLPDAVRDKYELEGWYDGQTKVGGAGDSYILNKSVTLRAKWTRTADYVITYDSNGGSGTMDNEVVTLGTEKLELPECAFTKYERAFYAWSVDSGYFQPGDKIPVTDDITVKAVWVYTTLNINHQDHEKNTTRVAGKLVLTDPDTGMQFIKNLEGETKPCGLFNPMNSEVERLIEDMKTVLQLTAGTQDGVADLKETVSDPVPTYTDRRTYKYYRMGAPELANYPAADYNGDLYDKTMLVEGEHGYEWLITVTLEGKYTSHPTSIEGKTIKLSGTSFTYNGKVQKPTIKTVGGMTLTEGKDYTAVWSNASSKNAGTYSVTVTGIKNYRGTATAKYTIRKAANPLNIKAKTAKVKYSSLKKTAKTLVVNKVIRFKKTGQGTMSYKLVSAKKDGKSFKSKFKINKTTGKVKLAKGLEKGTYKVKVKVKAAGNSNYEPSETKTITFTIKIN